MEDNEDQIELQDLEDDSYTPAAHNKLLGAVSELYEKKRVKAPTRKEPSLEVSEFHLSRPDKKRGQIKVTELAKVLNKRATHANISHKLKNAQKQATTLPKPLEKIHQDKINRKAGFQHAKQQLNRWDAIVYKQKVAEQLSFPLKSETVKIHKSPDVSTLFRKPTELEIELAKVLNQPDPLAAKDGEEKLNKIQEEQDYPLTLSEVIEKRKMMAKLRAQQSYQQAKAARHRKIKSKKFHQIQRKSRIKEQLREFEELQKKDPEEALKKLEELEKTRAEERMTLRHKSTGQWAKNLAVRAKYDKDARIALAEQLSKSRELTVKLGQDQEEDSEKEECELEENQSKPDEDPNNPWVIKQSKDMEDFVSGYRKYWDSQGKQQEKLYNTDTSVKVTSCPHETNELLQEVNENTISISANKSFVSIDDSSKSPVVKENTIVEENTNSITKNTSCIKMDENAKCSVVKENETLKENSTVERNKLSKPLNKITFTIDKNAIVKKNTNPPSENKSCIKMAENAESVVVKENSAVEKNKLSKPLNKNTFTIDKNAIVKENPPSENKSCIKMAENAESVVVKQNATGEEYSIVEIDKPSKFLNKNTFTVECAKTLSPNQGRKRKLPSNFNIVDVSIEHKTMKKLNGYNNNSWIVLNKKDKTSTKVNSSTEGNKICRFSNTFEVTISKTDDKIKGNNENKMFGIDVGENSGERPQKRKKTSDEMLEEIEDMLLSKVKDKIGNITEKCIQKRKVEGELDELEHKDMPSLEIKKMITPVDVDEELVLDAGNKREEKTESVLSKTLKTAKGEVKLTENIDPNKFLKVTPRHLLSQVPEMMTEGEDALDDEEKIAYDRHLTISEAFAEDDVVDQFQKEKDEEVKKNSIGNVDLTLPGWGSWAGHNMRPISRRKRKKFVIKFPKTIPRRDSNRGNVIINEDAEKPIKEHQVSEVPFPFTSVEEYEASIRAPLGSTWMPQTAHVKLTLPPVVTKMGAIIAPMDESQLVSKDKVISSKDIKKRTVKTLHKKKPQKNSKINKK